MSQKKDSLGSPIQIIAKRPVIVRLDTCPPPEVILVPTKPGGARVVKSDAGVPTSEQLLPPKTITTDFFVSTKNYNTEQGLAFSTVRSSYCDKNGYLWFGTGGNGVSRFDGKSFTNFTNIPALTNIAIERILEDRKGNLWFGTLGAGVSRYDGISFTNFTTEQGLANNNVYDIYEDKKGNLWFATNGGASKLNYDNKNSSTSGTKFKNYTTVDGLASNNISAITEDDSGNLWFSSGDNGVSMQNGTSFTNFTSANGLSGNSVYSMLKDGRGNLWFATMGRGVDSYDGKSFTNYTSKDGLVSDYISGIFEDSNGDLWFFSRGMGASCFNYAKRRFTTYAIRQGLMSNNIWSIVQDKEDNLWLSSFDNGIALVDNNLTSLRFNVPSSGSYNFLLQSIYEDKSGNLWLGGDGGGLSYLEYGKKSEINYQTSQGLINNHVFCITEDSKGNLWCGTARGVSMLDASRKVFTSYTTAQGIINDEVNRILEDKNGNLWFCTAGGLSQLDGARKTFTNYTKDEGLVSNYVQGILEDKNSVLWICTDSGVSKFDGKTFTNYSTQQGLTNHLIVNAIQDKDGNIWVATYGGGFSRLDRDQKFFMDYTTEQGLGDNKISAIAMDAKGVIWLGTSKGFTALRGFSRKTGLHTKENFLRPSNLLSNSELETSDYEPIFEVYNNNTGYAVRDINGNAITITHDSLIWAATSEKLVRFNPNNIHKSPNPPNVIIQGIKINNENICWYDLESSRIEDSAGEAANVMETTLFGKVLSKAQRDTLRQKFKGVVFDSIKPFYPVPLNLVLPYNHNNLTFDFAAIAPAKPNLVRYQHMLEGYDKTWNPVTDKNSASFGNIREGSYTFKLKGQSPDGIWSDPVTYSFRVLPPLYRSWWAYVLYALAFLSALGAFIRWRMSALKKEKKLLEEKVVTRTNELQKEKEKVESTLNDLKSTQSQLIQQAKMASLGELTAGIAHEIQNPLNFVNNFSEVNKELIDELEGERLKTEGERNKELELQIFKDLKQNLEKINQHGKRADSIVKGMLQHSRSTSGQKEPTDVNALADEYLKLSYHAMRAKEKGFNAILQTDFDKSLVRIPLVPQDIGRVLLNLFNNSFYSMLEKTNSNHKEYEPTISVSTKQTGNKALITVRDNGKGISEKIIDKIFQPFFTTKPTGSGTGLGLSISYDIITKEHGGEIKVESKEGEGAEFIVSLPA